MSQNIYVAVAESQKLSGKLLAGLLKAASFKISFIAFTARETIQKLEQKNITPDILIFDSLLSLDGMDLHAEIRKHWPDVKTLALSPFDDDEQAIRYLQQGVNGYIVKDEPEEVITALQNISEGRHHYPLSYPEYKSLRAHLGRFRNSHDFKVRELELMKLLCTDMSMEEIAAQMKLTDRQATRIKTSIYNKTGVNQRHMLVQFCIRYGIQQLSSMEVNDKRLVASV